MYNTTAEIKLLLESRHCEQIYKNIVKSHTRSIEPEFHSTLKKKKHSQACVRKCHAKLILGKSSVKLVELFEQRMAKPYL